MLELHFNWLEMESCAACGCDGLEIYDGDSSASPSLGIYCGQQTPRPIVASGSQLYLYFSSDSSVSGRGFEVRVTNGGLGGQVDRGERH